jgi:hypothetical protein
MPPAAYVLAYIIARPVPAERKEFKSSEPSTGRFNVEEVIVISRLHRFFCGRGEVS